MITIIMPGFPVPQLRFSCCPPVARPAKAKGAGVTVSVPGQNKFAGTVTPAPECYDSCLMRVCRRPECRRSSSAAWPRPCRIACGGGFASLPSRHHCRIWSRTSTGWSHRRDPAGDARSSSADCRGPGRNAARSPPPPTHGRRNHRRVNRPRVLHAPGNERVRDIRAGEIGPVLQVLREKDRASL